MSFVPTLAQEIERKSIDTLEKLAVDLELGRITKAQYLYGLDILWSAVAGLAGTDFTIMIETAKLPNRDKEFVTRTYYQSDKGNVVRITNSMTGYVVVDVNLGLAESRKLYNFRDEPNPTKQAAEKVADLEASLIGKGFKQI